MKNKEYEEIENGVIALNDPMFPLYIIRGDRPVLIDTGVSRKALLFQQRIRHVLGEQKLSFIVLTHTHWDHTGALSFLADAHQAEVVTSPAAADLLRKKNVIAFVNRLNREYTKAQELDALPAIHSPERMRTLSDGERLPLTSERSLIALACPGHTRCSQAYYLEPEGLLFPGDAVGVMEKNGEIRPLFLSSYTEYVHSLRKLSDLPSKTLAFAHNHFIQGESRIQSFFERSLAATELWFEKIKNSLEEGLEEQVIAECFFESHFLGTTLQSPKEVFLINIAAMIRAAAKALN